MKWERRKANGGWNVWNKGEYIEGLRGSEVTSYRWKSMWLVDVLLVHLFILLAAFNCFQIMFRFSREDSLGER